MSNYTLNEILKEYDKIKLKNIQELENKKRNLYSTTPKLKQIDNNLNNLSINTAKKILQKNNLNYLNNLKKEIEILKKQKKDILKSLNLPENYLELNYNCSFCKDTGYIFENGKSLMCNCLKQKLYNIEYNKKNINNISEDTFNNFNMNLFSDEINEKKYISKKSPRENILNIKNAAQIFIDNFNDENTKNLIFSGGTGLRKNFFI